MSRIGVRGVGLEHPGQPRVGHNGTILAACAIGFVQNRDAAVVFVSRPISNI